MLTCDALVVGGGPGGSSCARALSLAGWNVTVVDRAEFPRDKVCAGWITPEVFGLLELEPDTYRAAGLTLQAIRGFDVGTMRSRPVHVRYRDIVSYAIRRCEFDHYLLDRAAATVRQGTSVTSLRRDRGRWILNDIFEAPVLIGAGGHFCPVARYLTRGREVRQPVVAQEIEFVRGDTYGPPEQAPEIFFCRDFDGYAWCVPKGQYLNVGLGRRHAPAFARHRDEFAAFLVASGRAPADALLRWHGHAYFAAGAGIRPTMADGVLLIGDAAGVAAPESGEGIRTAIESGLAAARTLIAADGQYTRERLRPYDDQMRQLHPQRGTDPPAPSVALVGRTLLRSRAFVRHVVLDRWFLHRAA